MIWKVNKSRKKASDGQRGEENDDNIVDAEVINHFKETCESFSEEVINRFDDD